MMYYGIDVKMRVGEALTARAPAAGGRRVDLGRRGAAEAPVPAGQQPGDTQRQVRSSMPARI